MEAWGEELMGGLLYALNSAKTDWGGADDGYRCRITWVDWGKTLLGNILTMG